MLAGDRLVDVVSSRHHAERSPSARRTRPFEVRRAIWTAAAGSHGIEDPDDAGWCALENHVGGAAMRMPSLSGNGVPQAPPRVSTDTPREVHLWR